MADFRLAVSVDELKRGAAQIESQIANAQRNWQSLCATAETAKHYWEGDAADCRRRLFEESRQEMESVFQRLKNHPLNILKMAGIYDDAEEKSVQMTASLPDDAIL